MTYSPVTLKILSARAPLGMEVHTPKWWRNFLRENFTGSARYDVDKINHKLLDYSANYSRVVFSNHMSGYNKYLDFYDEQAYLWFVLRWS
jgi:hypothetical protein